MKVSRFNNFKMGQAVAFPGTASSLILRTLKKT
jgi:hypothetical protein